MRITHFAPFAPNRCGLYEAARDFVKADRLCGRQAEFVDLGIPTAEKREAPKPGSQDNRGDLELTVRSWQEGRDADLYVAHDWIPEPWLAETQVPVVFVIHGRPYLCFRPEQEGHSNAYSIVHRLGTWPRVKRLMYQWPEYTPYWRVLVPENKLVCAEDPPIDCDWYKPTGRRWPIPRDKYGEWNLLLADSWREDMDIFYAAHGAVAAAAKVPGLKVHFFATEHKDGVPLGAWNLVFDRLRSLGALGHIQDRLAGDMSDVYRAMDAVVTSHRIATRVIGEPLACGRPVIAAAGCRYTPYTATFDDMEAVGQQIARCISDMQADRDAVRLRARETAVRSFALPRFGERLGRIYNSALGITERQTNSRAAAGA